MDKFLKEITDNIVGVIFLGIGIVLLFLGDNLTVAGVALLAFGIGIIVGRHSG